MECPLSICSYPYHLTNGSMQCAEITQLDVEYFQITWIGDDGQNRGADMYGSGSEQRAHDYAEIVQDSFARNIPLDQADGFADTEGLNPPGPRYL
jgi:hypothetical protein